MHVIKRGIVTLKFLQQIMTKVTLDFTENTYNYSCHAYINNVSGEIHLRVFLLSFFPFHFFIFFYCKSCQIVAFSGACPVGSKQRLEAKALLIIHTLWLIFCFTSFWLHFMALRLAVFFNNNTPECINNLGYEVDLLLFSAFNVFTFPLVFRKINVLTDVAQKYMCSLPCVIDRLWHLSIGAK